jgi:triosephosphate isomerase
MKRVPLIIGNWKMYKTPGEAAEFIEELSPLVASTQRRVYLAPPFTTIDAAVRAAKGTRLVIGAQNMHDQNEGAFTGEVSARMLMAVGAAFVILGHSERRALFGEGNAWINAKVHRALAAGLVPVVCIGETLKERELGLTKEVVCRQLEECLKDVLTPSLASIIVAYEPVWAIGTGVAATPAHAQQVHKICRDFIEEKWSREASQQLHVLYGGSVKPDNIASLMSEVDIDGVLVGGASLDVKSFAQLVNY